MTTICLVAIVKNSGDILRESLQSFLPFIHSYCISYTGSTDDTMDMIRTECSSKPGYLFSEPFIDFSTNRNRVLMEAEERFPSDYYIMIDDSFILQNGKELLPFLEKNKHPYFCFVIKNNECEYLSGRVTTKSMRYQYRIHEVIKTNVIPITIQHCFLLEKSDPKQAIRSKHRFESDLILLKEEMKDHLDPSFIFYYAKTLFHLDRLSEAKTYFENRIFLGDSPYEMYSSFMYLAMIESDPLLKYEKYLSISESFPNEAEPFFYMGICLHEMKQYKNAIFHLEKGVRCPMGMFSKYIINEVYLPRLLAKFYYIINKESCLSFLYEKYHSFDFIMESYLLNILHNVSIAPYHFQLVVFHPTGDHMSTFSEKTLTEYQSCVSFRNIHDLIVYDATDRIPYFPNIKRIHYVLETELPKGTMLESFPMLTTIVYHNEEQLKSLENTYPYLSHLVKHIDLFEFKNTCV